MYNFGVICPECKKNEARTIKKIKDNFFELTARVWIICSNCGYNKESSEFKNTMLCK
tara:strand:- start:287 stop:457 length:171 start_codon:yes stop_codon:yes gene_type:complete